jgi:hypothetical protein
MYGIVSIMLLRCNVAPGTTVRQIAAGPLHRIDRE